jgi:hypothetical protein
MAIANMHQVLDRIIQTLFAAEERRLTNWVDRLCRMNQEARGEQTIGFLHNGQFYRPSNVIGPVPTKRALHPSLYPDIEKFLNDRTKVDEDKSFIRQCLLHLLEPCNEPQDMRDALPDCLVDCYPQLHEFQRSRAPAFTIQGNPRALRQYAKMLPLMEVYSAGRLIY